jgi:hypothetical protein
MLQASELQHMLNALDPFRGVEVRPLSVLAPWYAVLTGTVFIHGKPLFYETELDLREFWGQKDIARLATKLMASFEKAADGQLDD